MSYPARAEGLVNMEINKSYLLSTSVFCVFAFLNLLFIYWLFFSFVFLIIFSFPPIFQQIIFCLFRHCSLLSVLFYLTLWCIYSKNRLLSRYWFLSSLFIGCFLSASSLSPASLRYSVLYRVISFLVQLSEVFGTFLLFCECYRIPQYGYRLHVLIYGDLASQSFFWNFFLVVPTCFIPIIFYYIFLLCWKVSWIICRFCKHLYSLDIWLYCVWDNPRGAVVDLLGCNIVISLFEIQSQDDVGLMLIGKVRLPYPLSYALNRATTILLQGMVSELNIPLRLICHQTETWLSLHFFIITLISVLTKSLCNEE